MYTQYNVGLFFFFFPLFVDQVKKAKAKKKQKNGKYIESSLFESRFDFFFVHFFEVRPQHVNIAEEGIH